MSTLTKAGCRPRGAPGPGEVALEGHGDDKERTGALSDLIGIERRVLATTREAEIEAERAIAEARAELESKAAEHDIELEAAVRELRARLDRQRSQALGEIARQGDADAGLYLDIDESRVRVLADLVAKRVAEGEREPDADSAPPLPTPTPTPTPDEVAS